MAEMRPYADIIFWTAVVAIAYTYAGYPLLLMLLSKFRGNRSAAASLRRR